MTIHSHFGPQPVFSQCMHRRVRVIQNGGMHFSEGQVWDDIEEKVLCLDCLMILTEAEVRASWGDITNFSTMEK